MALYQLTLRPDFSDTLSEHMDFNQSFVIRADSPAAARRMASAEAMDEGKDTWLDNAKSSCHTLKVEGKSMIIATEKWAHP